MRGRSSWTKAEIKAKARWNRTKLRLLKFLRKTKKPVTSLDVASALKISREHASDLLLRVYRQRLVSRESQIRPLFTRYPARLPYLYTINEAGLKRLKYLEA